MIRVLILLLVILLTGPLRSEAVNKIYVIPETPILFADTAQVEDAALTLSALGNGAGRCSARYDRGAGAHSGWYKWRATFQTTSTVVVGTSAEVYLSTSDGTDPDGQIGTADAALATDKRLNLTLLGVVLADQTAANIDMTASGHVYIPDRYISICVWNAYGVAFRTDTSVHGVSLTPMPPEVQ